MYIQRMLDIKFIREHAGEVRIAITNKGIDLNLDELLAADIERSAALRALEDLNEAKNKLNDEMKAATTDEARKAIVEKGKVAKEKSIDLEPKFRTADAKFAELMARVPTIPSPDTPLGKSDADNVEVFHWGEPKKFDFAPVKNLHIVRITLAKRRIGRRKSSALYHKFPQTSPHLRSTFSLKRRSNFSSATFPFSTIALRA